ncbi:MAG: Crp/Fnr family transcriptional regulator [Runella sp.]
MPLSTSLHKIAPLSEQCQEAIRKVSQKVLYKKGRYLLRPEQTCTEIFFIENGLIRVFYETQHSEERTMWFGYEGDFVASVKSFFTQTPSYEYIEILEDSIFWKISFQELETLYKQYPELNYHFRKIYEHYLCLYQDRILLQKEPDCYHRYQLFLSLYPTLAYRLQVKHVAQYLNMTPNTLSRIRRELKEQKLI